MSICSLGFPIFVKGQAPKTLENLSKIKKGVEEIIMTANNGIKLHGQSIYCIVGQPNTGKSSLTNLLLKNDSSIVSSIPGTTRDSIQYEVKIEGCSLMIIDTAGLRRTDSKIEKEGIKKTKEALQKANRVMYIVDDQDCFSNEEVNTS